MGKLGPVPHREPAQVKVESMSEVVAYLDPNQFRSKYQRNNKRGGLKNLRCFPACGDMHRTRGFCGRPVELVLTPSSNAADLPNDWSTGYHCFAEFVRCESSRFNIGEKVSATIINSLERTGEHPIRPLIRSDFSDECEAVKGSVSKSKSIKFEFNRRRKGWHYGWTANKHSCNTEHCLQIYVMSYSSDCYEIKQIVRSPPFVLFCRRRRRFQMEPSAPVAPPKKRLREQDSTNGLCTGEQDSKKQQLNQCENRYTQLGHIAENKPRNQVEMKKFENMQEAVETAASLLSFSNSCHKLNQVQRLTVK
mmetsp:Transcript_17054/g.19400  ORF Transcript_17054/g.19400 Transcript_17054/m.19400 type:complete len:307 (-) Transcript_17054:714-1634(-)